MFVRTLSDLEKLDRIKFPAGKSFRSARYVTASDGLGFSYNENKVGKGTDLVVWLKHHWEANYIVSGKGEVTDLESNQSWPLSAGVLYVVGPNDRHRLHLTEDECHISIFHPPLTGNERFDTDGSYEPSGPIPQTKRRMFVRSLDELRQMGCGTTTDHGRTQSTCLLSEADDVGFVLAVEHLAEGVELDRKVGDQWQACHVLAGEGRVTEVASGQSWELAPGTAFNVEPSERYRLISHSELSILRITGTSPNEDVGTEA